MSASPQRAASLAKQAPTHFDNVRRASLKLAEPLSDADATVQSMPDASPAKWHLAHTTWFFERMILGQHAPAYRDFDETFNFLFNSYYETIGERQPRPARGMITRPTLDQIIAYRHHVDAAIADLLASDPADEVRDLVELGCHHEQQHQELLLTDILHLFAQNPLKPAYREPAPLAVDKGRDDALSWVAYDGGIVEIGHDANAPGAGFAFDCEGPRHRTLLEPYALADRLVTNAEWIDFIEDGGYRETLLWLSDGWAWVLGETIDKPLYWEKRDGGYWAMTLRGLQPIDPAAPVTHVSYFEADAFATWAGHRLPREAEWENAATHLDPDAGNMAATGRLRPRPAPARDSDTPALRQTYGDVWEWTASPFAAYPGFKAAEGAVGEYNGKFMHNQFVLRGGSCITPPGHIRPTYRNFFPAPARWQFTGLRLAKDL